jgi:serine/threonine protein kinase
MEAVHSSVLELSLQDRQTLEAWLSEFVRLWDEKRLAVQVKQLPPAPHPLRFVALLELAKIDLQQQWSFGRRIKVEAYLKALPELGTPETVFVELLLAEYEARGRAGDTPQLTDFVRRFPSLEEALRWRLENRWTPPLSSKPAVAVPAGVEHRQPSPGAGHPWGTGVRIPRQFGRYRIIRKLGRGGMGSVFLAQDSQLDRDVALKIPHLTSGEGPEVLERFYREARAAARLQHPNLCPVYDCGILDNLPYLTMVYIEGKPLSDLIQSGQPLSQHQAVSLVRQLALALQTAHQQGVIHRDLKPANVIINEQNVPIIVDFGLARHINAGDIRLTQTGMILGTPSYMPPEQIDGDVRAMGPGCDIYSLGVILYQLLTGRLPFEGPTAASVMAQSFLQEPARPSKHRPDLDSRLESVCLKAMAKKVEQRYASMEHFARALLPFLEHPATGVKRTTSIWRVMAERFHVVSPRLWVGISSGLTLILMVVLLTMIGGRNEDSSDQFANASEPNTDSSLTHNKHQATSNNRKDNDADGKDGSKSGTQAHHPREKRKEPSVTDFLSPVAIQAPKEGRQPAGKYVLPKPEHPTVLLQYDLDKKEWKRLTPENRSVLTGSRLVSLPGYRSKVDLDQGVRLTLWGTLPELYEYHTELLPVKASEKETKKLPVPFLMNVLESIVTLHQPPEGLDVDLTLYHGRLLLANQKTKGPVRIRVRVNDPSAARKADKPWEPEYQAVWDVTLDDPGSELALELIGFFDPHHDYKPLNSPEHRPPVAVLKMTALKGQSHVRHHEVAYRFQAPPGPALMEWSSTDTAQLEEGCGGMVPVRSESPRKVDRLPEWFSPNYPELPVDMPQEQRELVLKTRTLAVKALAELNRMGSNPEGFLSQTLEADDIREGSKGPPPEKVLAQLLALRCFAALDDLPPLLSCLTDSEHRRVRQTAHLVLRNYWLAREPDHEQMLYDACVERFVNRKQAEVILELMHDLSLNERYSPDRREALIVGLKDKNLVIRELCAYALYSLFPAGAGISYDPAGPSTQLEDAYEAWQKLNQEGKLIPLGGEMAPK